ncbi:MAG: HAD-IC family P-type ATPase, partial [Clostridia bacterium]
MSKHCDCNKHEHERAHSQCGCDCGGCGHEEEESRFLLPRLLIAAAVLLAAIFSGFVPLYFAAYIIAGYDVVISAVKGIFNGGVFNENFLMTIATIGAFCIGEYPEGVAVMIFYGLGEYIQDKAVDKSSDSINELIRLRPDHASIYSDGKKTVVSPSDVKVGDVITVAPGERIPLDGVLLSPSAVGDTCAITGESVPREFNQGAQMLSGIINMKSEILIEVTHTLENSSTERIFRMVTEAREKKSRSERFISRFAKVYTPVVVIAALILAFIPPIFVGNLSEWVHRGLIFLVASCPCAVVLSIPLTYFAGMGLASRNGILFKGGVYLEQLAKLNTAAFDKTGTLTKGELEVTAISPADGISEEELLH